MTDTRHPELSIVIPALNEAEALRDLLPELRKRFPDAEILVVDDGSSDDTAGLTEQAGCTALRSPYRMGNGAAIKRGARAARGRVIATMDADGQHRPEELAKLLEAFDAKDFDMIVGARASAHQASLSRWFGNGLLNRLASWMTNQRVEDLTSGIRVVDAEKFKEFLHLLPNGFSYPTTITMAFFRSGYPVAYEPITVARRTGRSHIRIVRDGIRFLLIVFKIGSFYSPMKLFLPISATAFALGALLYGYTFITQGRFTNMSALLFMTSLLTFLMGIISEQITNLMFARRNR